MQKSGTRLLKYIQSFLLLLSFLMKIDEIPIAHITNLKKEVLPLYMAILSSNEDRKHLNVCHISFDFNEENLFNKQTFFF